MRPVSDLLRAMLWRCRQRHHVAHKHINRVEVTLILIVIFSALLLLRLALFPQIFFKFLSSSEKQPTTKTPGVIRSPSALRSLRFCIRLLFCHPAPALESSLETSRIDRKDQVSMNFSAIPARFTSFISPAGPKNRPRTVHELERHL